MNLSPYLPLNTTEKVDQLLIDAQKIELFGDADRFELNVLLIIKKAKIQLYFKEQLKAVKSKLKFVKEHKPQLINIKKLNPTKNPATTAKPSKPVKLTPQQKQKKKEKVLPKFKGSEVIDKRLRIVARYVGCNPTKLIRLLEEHYPIINLSTVLNQKKFAIVEGFLNSEFDKMIAERNKKVAFKLNPKKKAEKFKPSFGKEGNYRKLIYIRTKS